MSEGAAMEPSAVGDDLNEVSTLLNVAHRLLVGLRDDVEADPALQAILEDLNAAHDQVDLAMETLGRAQDGVDALADGPPREERPPIH
jgi:hypothetical protein